MVSRGRSSWHGGLQFSVQIPIMQFFFPLYTAHLAFGEVLLRQVWCNSTTDDLKIRSGGLITVAACS